MTTEPATGFVRPVVVTVATLRGTAEVADVDVAGALDDPLLGEAWATRTAAALPPAGWYQATNTIAPQGRHCQLLLLGNRQSSGASAEQQIRRSLEPLLVALRAGAAPPASAEPICRLRSNAPPVRGSS
jgi:hypothetical protein